MRRYYLARLEVRSGTYIMQLHRNGADAAIHPARTSCLGNSHMPDTFRCMESNRCFAEMWVEISTWYLVCSVIFTNYVCRRVDPSIHLLWQICSLCQSVVVSRISVLVPIYGYETITRSTPSAIDLAAFEKTSDNVKCWCLKNRWYNKKHEDQPYCGCTTNRCLLLYTLQWVQNAIPRHTLYTLDNRFQVNRQSSGSYYNRRPIVACDSYRWALFEACCGQQ